MENSLNTGVENLKTLLRQEQIDNAEDWFDKISKQLFYKVDLMIKDKRYKITEIEYYLYNKQHKDHFTHQSEEQKTCGMWYFHKKGNGFKEGRIKGVDITIGEANRVGGILIRGIQALDGDEQYVDGPGNFSQTILDIFNVEKVKELAATVDLNIFEPKDIWLVETSTRDEETIYKAPRVGLTLKGELQKEKEEFIMREYRHIAKPLKTKRGLPLLCVALETNGYNAQDIVGVKENKLKERMGIYNLGISGRKIPLEQAKSDNNLIHMYGISKK